MSGDFLGGIYKDLFGNSMPGEGAGGSQGSAGGAGNVPPEGPPAGGQAVPGDELPGVPESPAAPPAGNPFFDAQNDALAQAREALEEAKKLFGGIEKASQGTGSVIDETLGSFDRIKEEVMKDFLGEGAPVPGAGSGEAENAGGQTEEEAQAEETPEEPEEDPMEQLDGLIGLTTIKRDVKELTDFVSVQKMRKEEGLKSVPVSLHLVFTGNPGTGKTTVARIIGKLYKKIGVLPKGQLVEVDRSGLVAGYVGQTALKTQDKIAEAMGGVLFIDEAYSLAQKDDAFGQEAIDTILKAMEDYRDELVVIVAGYTKPMEKFINSNPGLKSRFNKYIEFPDYTVDELEQIFYMNCRKYDYHVEEDAGRHIREMITLAKLTKQENFANAREVRNLFEKIITNQAQRVRLIESPSHDDMMTITMEDLPSAIDDDGDGVPDAPAGISAGIRQETGGGSGPEAPVSKEAEEPGSDDE